MSTDDAAWYALYTDNNHADGGSWPLQHATSRVAMHTVHVQGGMFSIRTTTLVLQMHMCVCVGARAGGHVLNMNNNPGPADACAVMATVVCLCVCVAYEGGVGWNTIYPELLVYMPMYL